MTCDQAQVNISAKDTPDKTPKRRGAEGPGRKCGHTCNAVKEGQLLYVFGGSDRDDHQTNDVHVFDTAKRMWSKPNVKGVAPSPRYSHTCTTVGQKLFVFGGTDETCPKGDLHILDTDSNCWSSPATRGECPPARKGHSSALIGHRLFVIGGCGKYPHSMEEVYLNDLYILDTETLVWTKGQTVGSATVGMMEREKENVLQNGLGPTVSGSRKRQASSNEGPGLRPRPELGSGAAGYGSQDSNSRKRGRAAEKATSDQQELINVGSNAKRVVRLDNLREDTRGDGRQLTRREGTTFGKTVPQDGRMKQIVDTKRGKSGGEGNTNDSRDRKHRVKQKDRKMSDFSWLLLTEVGPETRYIPQCGDDVVYFMQGHKEYLDMEDLCKEDFNKEDSIGTGPWNNRKLEFRAVAFCRIIELEYSILHETGQTYCELSLRFTDQSSRMFGESFKVTLPKLGEFIADFIVEKSRYEAGVKKGWRTGDKCQVWWKPDADDDAGKWLDGTIISSNPYSQQFPDSPWEQFTVLYTVESDVPERHNPWDLFEPGNHFHDPPHIDDETKEHILDAITEREESRCVEKKDEVALRRLIQDIKTVKYRNKVPLPLSFEVVKQRLEKNYYRKLDAFRHDVQLLHDNTMTFYGVETEMGAIVEKFYFDLEHAGTWNGEPVSSDGSVDGSGDDGSGDDGSDADSMCEMMPWYMLLLMQSLM